MKYDSYTRQIALWTFTMLASVLTGCETANRPNSSNGAGGMAIASSDVEVARRYLTAVKTYLNNHSEHAVFMPLISQDPTYADIIERDSVLEINGVRVDTIEQTVQVSIADQSEMRELVFALEENNGKLRVVSANEIRGHF